MPVRSLVLERQDHAFALPAASLSREPIDATLLQAINSPDWQARVAEYLGDGDWSLPRLVHLAPVFAKHNGGADRDVEAVDDAAARN